MRWKERVERMLEVYCNNIKDPLERVYLKYDLFYPLAKLPEVVEDMVSQNYNPSVLCFTHLSKRELAKIEKDCTESLILSRALLSPLCMAGRVDLELKEVVSKRPSILQGLNPWTKSRLLHDIADDVWQNVFDALLDDPEVIAERTELEIKKLAQLKGGERREHEGEITVDREFCNSLVSYLLSKLESTQGKPSPR